MRSWYPDRPGLPRQCRRAAIQAVEVDAKPGVACLQDAKDLLRVHGLTTILVHNVAAIVKRCSGCLNKSIRATMTASEQKMLKVRTRIALVSGALLVGVLIALAVVCVLTCGVAPSCQDVIARRFRKIENFFTGYTTSAQGSCPQSTDPSRDTCGGQITWTSARDADTTTITLWSLGFDREKGGKERIRIWSTVSPYWGIPVARNLRRTR